jgi:hypothetical protein
MDDKATKILLREDQIPRRWYNVLADMPNKPQPPLHPGTGKPVGPDDLAAIFPMGLIEQEVSPERYISIPEEVLDKLAMWRPTPLVRARRFEAHLGTPARIYKNEGVSPPGCRSRNSERGDGGGGGLLSQRCLAVGPPGGNGADIQFTARLHSIRGLGPIDPRRPLDD